MISEILIDEPEVYRYLGYGRHQADEQVRQLVASCIIQMKAAAEPKHVSRVFPLSWEEDGRLNGGCFQTTSRRLSDHLAECSEVLVFAATLGVGADQLIRRYSKLEMSRAVVLQAVGTAMIEGYCDWLNDQWRQEYEKKGQYLRTRFSPGYGDFELENQKTIVAALETGKRIGVTLTDSLLMVPAKSVTAVMGIGSKPEPEIKKGCEACNQNNCPYGKSRGK